MSDDSAACDIGCDRYGYPIRPVRAETVSAPEITDAMIEAGREATGRWTNSDADIVAVYRAMRAARPLSEGPV